MRKSSGEILRGSYVDCSRGTRNPASMTGVARMSSRHSTPCPAVFLLFRDTLDPVSSKFAGFQCG